MPALDIILDGDGAWPDAKDDHVLIADDARLAVAALAGGMASGKPSIAIRLDVAEPLADGTRAIIVQTSWALFASATRAIAVRFGRPW